MLWKKINKYWFEDVKPEQRFTGGKEIDDNIRSRFLDDWESAMRLQFEEWRGFPEGALALIILLDQFSRNMFRGEGRAFSSDEYARTVARSAVEQELELVFPNEKRHFFYMPFMHSESLTDQDYCIRLIKERLGDEARLTLIHAIAHRRLIEMFGRFPFRNVALARESTREEIEWLENSGYQNIVRKVEQEMDCQED